jgi:hypothetical protein
MQFGHFRCAGTAAYFAKQAALEVRHVCLILRQWPDAIQGKDAGTEG